MLITPFIDRTQWAAVYSKASEEETINHSHRKPPSPQTRDGARRLIANWGVPIMETGKTLRGSANLVFDVTDAVTHIVEGMYRNISATPWPLGRGTGGTGAGHCRPRP
jgi:hypothetical protein